MKFLSLKAAWLLVTLVSGGLTSCQIIANQDNQPIKPVEISKPVEKVEQSSPPVLVSESDSIAQLEQAIFNQVNQYRQSQSLPALRWNNRISKESRIHSQKMANNQVPISHEGFKQRVEAINVTLPATKSAENVAYNKGYQNPVAEAVRGWINSPGHQKNMVGDFNYTGVGVAINEKGEYYFTQIFVLSKW